MQACLGKHTQVRRGSKTMSATRSVGFQTLNNQMLSPISSLLAVNPLSAMSVDMVTTLARPSEKMAQSQLALFVLHN